MYTFTKECHSNSISKSCILEILNLSACADSSTDIKQAEKEGGGDSPLFSQPGSCSQPSPAANQDPEAWKGPAVNQGPEASHGPATNQGPAASQDPAASRGPAASQGPAASKSLCWPIRGLEKNCMGRENTGRTNTSTL